MTPSNPIDRELYEKLKAITFMRLVFSTVLLGFTTILHLRESPSPLARSLLFFYALIAGIFLLSLIYAIFLERTRKLKLFAYIQAGVDTSIITVIIYITGSFSSVFSFLYLIVVIYVNLLPFRKLGYWVASLSSLQYGLMIDLEYYGILAPLDPSQYLSAAKYVWNQVIFKVVITMAACFIVAFMGRLLADQSRRHREKAKAMEERAKRMERLAAVGEMAAGLAHEIKNPLASLKGSIQMLSEDLPGDPIAQRLMQIGLRETDRLSTLVSNFLVFARPPAGNPEPLDLGRAIGEIVNLFEKDKNCVDRIKISRHLHKNKWVQMDPAQLHQVLWNLLLNAAEAISGPGEIDVTMRPRKNNRVEVRIKDTGGGIAPKTKGAIFDPFFTTKATGTGLGLSIVLRILDSYAVWLDCDTRTGHGTTFILTFETIQAPT